MRGRGAACRGGAGEGLGPGLPPPAAGQRPPYLWAVRSVETWLMPSPWWEEAATGGFPRSSGAAAWATSSATGELRREENTRLRGTTLGSVSAVSPGPKQGLFPSINGGSGAGPGAWRHCLTKQHRTRSKGLGGMGSWREEPHVCESNPKVRACPVGLISDLTGVLVSGMVGGAWRQFLVVTMGRGAAGHPAMPRTPHSEQCQGREIPASRCSLSW